MQSLTDGFPNSANLQANSDDLIISYDHYKDPPKWVVQECSILCTEIYSTDVFTSLQKHKGKIEVDYNFLINITLLIRTK